MMPRKKSEIEKVMISFAIPKDVACDFDLTIEEFNKRNQTNFSRSAILQILILKYIVNTNMDFKKEDTEENKEEN